MTTELLSRAVDAGIDFSPNVSERRSDPQPGVRSFFEQLTIEWSSVLEAYDQNQKSGQRFLTWLRTRLGTKNERVYSWFEMGFFTLETIGVALRGDAPLDDVLTGYRGYLEKVGVLIAERDEIERLIRSFPVISENERGTTLLSIREILRERARIIETEESRHIAVIKRPTVIGAVVVGVVVSVAAGMILDVIPNPFAEQPPPPVKIIWGRQINPENPQEYRCTANAVDVGAWRHCKDDGVCDRLLGILELCERLYSVEAQERLGLEPSRP